MKLRKEEKISLLQVVDKLIEVGRKFKAISNQEIDEIYEDYLDLLEGGSKGLLEYLEIYKERKSASEKIIRMIEQIREIIGNYFEFIDDEDGDSLEASLELLKDLRKKSEEIEIDIFADLPPPSIKLALTFDDSVKINGLILHLLDLGKKLDEEFDKENDPLRKDNLRNEFLNILKNDTDLIEKEEKLYDRECPVDIKMIHILEETLQVIEGYKSFIEGQQDINTVRGLMDQLKRTSSPLQEILAGHDKELKLLGLVNYLMDTGKKLKIIHKTMDGEEAEGAI
ncbi:MAG TPA: hypothetical protein PL110_11345, partial [Candidatus Eremiobacteraeota bacterium]|nr:hypothetical protein [Candidatus Eremiobacteraeota bacterium]